MNSKERVRAAISLQVPDGVPLGSCHSIAKRSRYENFMAMLGEYDRLKDKFRT